jgi:2',3'-cyclic-nucleotide 2'-phosphodiesterase (5'-nucleotidase family)
MDTTDGDLVTGGYSRIAGLINEIRAAREASDIPVLVFDSGDFFMGTIYDMTLDDPITLRFFQLMQYSAITLGNHEFDYMPEGLALMLNNALSSAEGFDIPIVASNTITDASPDATGDDDLEELFANGTISKKLIFDLPNGLRVGALGIIGPEADTAAPLAPPVTFNNDYGYLQGLVDELRYDDVVDLVVILSHTGIHENGSGDDAMMAYMVDGIDVILSGHYHEVTPKPYEINGAIIYIPGEYGEWLSRLDVKVNVTYGGIEEYDFELIRVDDTITGDASIQDVVDTYDATIDALLMGAVLVGLDTPMVELSFDLEGAPMAESGLCNMAADGIRRATTMLAFYTFDPSPIYSVAAFPSGAARDGLYATNIGYATFADIYNVVPLGVSPDPDNQNVLGWPLVSIWLTPAELKDMAEVSVSIAAAFGLGEIFVCFSGMRVDYDPYGPTLPADRVKAIRLCGNAIPIVDGGDGDFFSTDCTNELDLEDDTTLYRVVTDMFNVLFLGEVKKQTGLIIDPKYADGTLIIPDGADRMEIMNARVDMDGDPDNGVVMEMKSWMALLDFVTSEAFPDNGGIPGVPEVPGYIYDATGIAMGRFNPI